MNKRFLYLASLTGILLSAISYLLIANFKLMPSGDETISYLCATGNQQNYQHVIEKQSVYGKETAAGEWKYFLTNHPGSLQNISKDLVKTDLHPPLYFWLLHFFTLLPVSLFTSGLILNFLLHSLSLLVLMRICTNFNLNRFSLLFVLIAWTLSPAILPVGFHARPYELLGLFNLLAFYSFINYHESAKKTHLILFIFSLVGGMLTQYLFIYFAFCFAAVAILVLKNKKLFISMFICIAVSLLLVYIIHPGILHQFATQQARAQAAETGGFVTRIGKVLLSFIQIFIPVMNLKTMFLSLPKAVVSAVCGIIFMVLAFIAFKNRKRFSFQKQLHVPALILWMTVLSLTLIILPYLLFLTPMQAMGRQYFVLVYPYLVIALAIILSQHTRFFAAAISLIIVGFMIEMIGVYRQQQSYQPLLDQLSKSEMVIVNTVNRRAFTRLIPDLDNQKILMDENTQKDPAGKQATLFISEELTRPKNVSDKFSVYDLQDGVVLYTLFKE